MSETQVQETEYVAGVVQGITQKGPDKWQVAVQPDGSQYAKNLWTKDEGLVGALAAKIGSHGAFVCGVSHWTNQSGAPVRSLWINEVSEERLEDLQIHASVTQSAVPSLVGKQTGAGVGFLNPPKPDVDWDAKERRDFMSRAWAQTISAFTHTIKVDEKPEDVFLRLQPFQRKVYQDICGRFAYPEDDNDVPF